jgi:predicted acetyltransferase
MKIDYPTQSQMDDLRSLWQEAFRDEDAFLDLFYASGFSPDRCRCATVDGKLAAALYWFDCSFQGHHMAYLYGIATAKAFRGKGVCSALMENTHTHLKYLGYDGVILVPADEGLFGMYGKMGYRVCASVSEFTCYASDEPVAMHPVDTAEFCRLRREFLPEGGILQEGDSIAFLQNMADFYAGEDFLVTIYRDKKFFAPELLGNAQSAPGILAAMDKKQGRFRAPGGGQSFAMFHNLSDMPVPSYLGLAFD